jgi:hypothetical protein
MEPSMKESMQEAVDAMDTELRPAGFARRKAVWNHRHDALIDVVDLQVSKGGEDVTLNCGVLDPVVHLKAWSSEVPQFVQEPDCTVRARIGELLPERLDVWWQLAARLRPRPNWHRSLVLPSFRSSTSCTTRMPSTDSWL